MKRFLLLLITATFACSTYAQNPSEGGAFENFGVNLKVGALYGAGIDFSTSLHPMVKARVGFSYLGYDVMDQFDISSSSGGLNEGKIQFSNANVLVDFFPMKNGVFHITAGAYIGKNNVTIGGDDFDPFQLNDFIINPKDGHFDGTVKFGQAIKPYLGIGIGRTIPNKRVGFKFELGVIYQGKMSVDSQYLSSDATTIVDDTLEIPLLESKVWPSVSFSLIYRIK